MVNCPNKIKPERYYSLSHLAIAWLSSSKSFATNYLQKSIIILLFLNYHKVCCIFMLALILVSAAAVDLSKS